MNGYPGPDAGPVRGGALNLRSACHACRALTHGSEAEVARKRLGGVKSYPVVGHFSTISPGPPFNCKTTSLARACSSGRSGSSASTAILWRARTDSICLVRAAIRPGARFLARRLVLAAYRPPAARPRARRVLNSPQAITGALGFAPQRLTCNRMVAYTIAR